MPKLHRRRERNNPTVGIIVVVVMLCIFGLYWYTYLRYNQDLGKIDVKSYCKTKYNESSKYKNDIWHCGNTPLAQKDWDDACQTQKNNPSAKGFRSGNSNKVWKCYAPSTF
jgi:hypothetical protein